MDGSNKHCLKGEHCTSEHLCHHPMHPTIPEPERIPLGFMAWTVIQPFTTQEPPLWSSSGQRMKQPYPRRPICINGTKEELSSKHHLEGAEQAFNTTLMKFRFREKGLWKQAFIQTLPAQDLCFYSILLVWTLIKACVSVTSDNTQFTVFSLHWIHCTITVNRICALKDFHWSCLALPLLI